MKRTRGEKERWEDFEARVGIKRSGGEKKETHKAAPNDILVQRMSSTVISCGSYGWHHVYRNILAFVTVLTL